MTVIREIRSKRLIQRVTAPLWVTVDGETVMADDWSLGGFGVPLARPVPRGELLSVRLAFPVGNAELAFATTCEVVHAGADGRYGLRFVDLSPDQLELLRQMWIAATTGQVVPFDACLAAPPAPPPDSPEPAALTPRRALRRLIGYAVLLAAGAAVLAGLLVSFHARFMVVRADHAAMTVPVLRMRAPVDGRLSGNALPTGLAVPAGTPLFDLAGPELAADIELADADLARLAATILSLRQRRTALQAFFADYAELADSSLRRAEADRGRAAAALELAERDLSRWEELARAGFAAQARLDQAQQRYTQAEQVLAGAEAAIEQATANQRMARQGRWFTGSRVEGAEPAKLDEDLRQAEAAHVVQARRLAALMERRAGLLVASPCDCAVMQSLAAPGEWLSAGSTVYLLRPRDGTAVLSVKVAQDKADLVALGDRAVVRLAGAETAEQAVVLAISRAPPADGRFGLPDSLERDPRWATLSLRLPPSAAEPPAGTPAQVLFSIPPRRLLFAWTGWGG